MRIIKIFNNNIVATRSENGEEMILTGAGIGFQKKLGDLVSKDRIEKVYEVREDGKDRLYRLFGDTPMELIDAAQKIRDRAKDVLGIQMTMQALVGMIDHITYAVERKKKWAGDTESYAA